MLKTITFALALFFSIQIWGQGGILNTSFNSGGIATTSFSLGNSQADDIIVQPDGKVIAVGFATINSISTFALARYNTNGTLDPTFGGTGKITTPVSIDGSWAKAIALQPNGKIVVSGSVSNGTQVDFALARYNSDGTLDINFGNNGIVITSTGNYSYINDMALQPDGKIVVAGEIYNGTNFDFAVGRYNDDGSLDAGFSGGIVTTAMNGDDYVKAVKIQPDGRIVVAGTSNFTFALARFTTVGTLDLSFGVGGKVTTVVGSVQGNDNGMALTLQGNGKILVSGQAFNPPFASDIALVRYTTNGNLDLGFGVQGIVLTDVFGGFDHASSVSIQNDGKIIVGGGTVETGQSKLLLMRYSSNGNVDNTFGVDGKTVVSLGSEAYTYAMHFSGLKIYLAGVVHNNPSEFAIASFTNNATPLPLQLLSFTAEKQGNKVLLQWQTENEVNTKSIAVERSDDARNFTSFIDVAAAGNSSSVQKYSVVDEKPFSSINYYRLKLLDIDGSFFYSKVLAVKNNIKSIEIFPNPVHSIAQLQLPSGINGQVRIDVIDVGGKLAKSMNLQLQGNALSFPINFENLLKGFYFIKVTGAEFNFSQKILKD